MLIFRIPTYIFIYAYLPKGWFLIIEYLLWPLSPALQAYYFDRDDQALHNFAKFFRNQSHEEREHAEKLMKVQNQRGGRIFLQDIRVRAHLNLKRFFSGLCMYIFCIEFVFMFWAIVWLVSRGQRMNQRYEGREDPELLIFTDSEAQPI